MLIQRSIIDLLSERQPLLSVEFFPPKTDAAVDSLVEAASLISKLEPDFVSVTYGAGGSTRDRSATVCRKMKDDLGLQVMPHLTCVGSTQEELGTIVDEFHDLGYRNIMALRGDPPKGADSFQATAGGFRYASDLVRFVTDRQPEICLGIAGYPEKHPEAPSLESDIGHLKRKVDSGGKFITTQLFFENTAYYRYVERLRKSGIELPVIPGIMPVLSLPQIKRITELCRAELPEKLESSLRSVGEDAEAVRRIGVEWAMEQIKDLVAHGAPGVHLYALNKADSAVELMEAFRKRRPLG